MASPAFSADLPPGTTPADEIDPATGLARSSVVKPLLGPGGEAAPSPDAPATARPAAAAEPAAPPPRPHIALILPTLSPALGPVAEAVRQGFLAAAAVAGKEALPVQVTATDNEGDALLAACRKAQAAGALVVVAGLTRDGATSLAASDCPRQPLLALNEPKGDLLPTVYVTSLSLEQEARLAALAAVNDGFHKAVVIHTPSTLSRRVEEAFTREWTRAGGEVHRIQYTGSPEEPAGLRERIAASRPDMVFVAMNDAETRDVRPYISAMLPLYATSMSVNPRAEPVVNVDLEGVRYWEMPWFAQPDHPAVMAYPPPRTPLPLEQERLYAFGIDAFRLALAIVKGDPAKAPLDGVTGKLVLEGRTFARTPMPAEVDGGRVIPLRTTP